MECDISHGKVIIPCEERLLQKFKAIKAAGPSELHLLSDYD